MLLPSAYAPNWYLHDFRQAVIYSQPAAGGLATAMLAQVPHAELWLLDRIVVQSDSATATAAFLYLDQVDDRNVLDGTRVGNFDVADQSQPIQLPGSSRLLVQWQGASNGAVGTARVQLRLLRQAAS